MARKKRLDREAVLNTDKNSILHENQDAERQIYKTAVYVRLSIEDSGKKNGESLENQIAMLMDYVEKKPDLSLYRVYIDNGSTGTNFDREAFREMEMDMNDGLIDCIVTKDLSRFGRDYLEVGRYLEEIFQKKHIRFISVNDGYDSLEKGNNSLGLIIPLKNLMNAAYSKDISKKVSSAFKTKQNQGKFLGNYPPFGYLKDPSDKNHLIVDQETKEYVQMIFRWKLEGATNEKIARRLNDMGVPHPYKYLYEKGLMRSEQYKNVCWNRTLIRRLIQKEVYMGDMVSGKERSDLLQGLNRHRTDKTEWIVVRDTHEPLVSREDFAQVQELIKKDKERKFEPARELPEWGNIYKGIIHCGICGNRLKPYKYVYWRKKEKVSKIAGYECITQFETSNCPCRNIKITRRELDETITVVIRENMKWFLSQQQILQSLQKHEIFSEKRANLRYNTALYNKLRSRNAVLYEQYKNGVIQYHEYVEAIDSITLEENRLQIEIAKLENDIIRAENIYESIKDQIRTIEKYTEFQTLSQEIWNAFVKNIVVYEDKRLAIHFKFRDEVQSLLDGINGKEGGM